MIKISKEQFEDYASQGYNKIPVVRELLADMDTPLSAYRKLADEPYTYLLESVLGGEEWGRYSFIGLSTDSILRVVGDKVSIEKDNRPILEKQSDDPLAEIEAFQNKFRIPHIEGLPRFTGGLVGYFGYDTIQYIEPRLKREEKNDPLDCPNIMLLVSDRVVVFDNVSAKLLLVVHADPKEDMAYSKAQEQLDQLEKKLYQPLQATLKQDNARKVDEQDFVSGFTQNGFKKAVDTIKNYIVEGDAMQVVISQRLSIPFQAPSLNLYRALRSMNPSPYMFYFDFDDFKVVGASPEMLVRLENDIVTVRPIAGTRPRGKDEAEDKTNEADLLTDPKELAEHLMLIDLGRNDTGRVCEIGSVRVTEKMGIERYSHVMHIVSNVEGKNKEGKSAIDVLRAAFPAGTLSGAPKIRAMEIVDELEPVKRGVYSGAVGYLSWDGNMDTAIAIRTAIIKDETLHIQVGAGIVADSVASNEWNETMNKGRATFHAASVAEKGMN